MQVPQFVVNVVVFAIFFPLLMWLFKRKNCSWLESLVAIAIYAALMAVFTFTGVGRFFSLH